MAELFEQLSTLLDQPHPDPTKVALLMIELQSLLSEDLVIPDALWLQLRGPARAAGLGGIIMLMAVSLENHLKK